MNTDTAARTTRIRVIIAVVLVACGALYVGKIFNKPAPPKSPTQLLAQYASAPDNDRKRETIGALAEVGQPAVAPLVAAIGGSDAALRDAAGEALGGVMARRPELKVPFDQLVGLFDSDDPAVRLSAVTATKRLLANRNYSGTGVSTSNYAQPITEVLAVVLQPLRSLVTHRAQPETVRLEAAKAVNSAAASLEYSGTEWDAIVDELHALLEELGSEDMAREWFDTGSPTRPTVMSDAAQDWAHKRDKRFEWVVR